MEIWLLVIILLIIAIIFLVASLFTRNDSDIEDLINDNTIQLSQELNAVKTRLSELESVVYAPAEDYQPSHSSVDKEVVYNEAQYHEEPVEYYESEEENYQEAQVNDATRNHIIQYYSQGYTMQEIADEVNLDMITIQSIVDDYIENR